MILVDASAIIEAITPSSLQLIEYIGRVCYKSEEHITHNSSERFVATLIKNGHESVLEHASASVRFIVDRGVSHEIVRHRIASFSQESTRYCDYAGEVTFIKPVWFDMMKKDPSSHGISHAWLDQMTEAERVYKYMRQMGCKPENARAVLPNSLKTELIMTANFREWRHFLRLRTSARAHPQMREVTIPLLGEFKQAVPVVFDDL